MNMPVIIRRVDALMSLKIKKWLVDQRMILVYATAAAVTSTPITRGP